jgi:hypothetical protein
MEGLEVGQQAGVLLESLQVLVLDVAFDVVVGLSGSSVCAIKFDWVVCICVCMGGEITCVHVENRGRAAETNSERRYDGGRVHAVFGVY